MKKAISMILVLLLAMQLTACGGSEKEIRGEVTPAASAAQTTTGETVTAETTEKKPDRERPEDPTEETEAETKETQQTDSEEEQELTMGSTVGGTYTSTFLGLRCTLGGDWAFYSDEEILGLNEMTQDMMDEDMAERIRNADTIQDMYAVNVNTGETVNITISNTGSLFGTVLSADAYADAAMPQLVPAMENIGLGNVKVEKGSISFAGKQETTILISGDFDGVPFYETMVVLKRGSYVAAVTAASYLMDTTKGTLEAFDVL